MFFFKGAFQFSNYALEPIVSDELLHDFVVNEEAVVVETKFWKGKRKIISVFVLVEELTDHKGKLGKHRFFLAFLNNAHAPHY